MKSYTTLPARVIKAKNITAKTSHLASVLKNWTVKTYNKMVIISREIVVFNVRNETGEIDE